MQTRVIDLASPAETDELGRCLAEHLFPGAVVALIGQLGAGKTHLVRAIVLGLGGDARQVTSPTFVLIQEYEAGLPIYHFDAYRLGSAAEFDDLGAHEYFEGDGVCLVEWADKVSASMPGEYLEIRMIVTGEESRRVEWTPRGARYRDVVAAILSPP